MKIVTSKKDKVVKFESLEEGEVFKEEGSEQLKIKTDDDSGCCLENGEIEDFNDDEKVIAVACELRVL